MYQYEELGSLFKHLAQLDYIDPKDVPNIDLYMDQVTTFMDSRLEGSKRYPDDKILTKTMINNYAKNDLLPPPVKKKYSKEHLLLLIFIYYMKSFLSIGDIQTLLKPMTEKYFSKKGNISLEDIYGEILSLQKSQLEDFNRDVKNKFKAAAASFSQVPDEEQQFLQTFAFACSLSFDVYLKKQMLEQIIDDLKTKDKK